MSTAARSTTAARCTPRSTRGLPVVITGGGSPTSYPGSFRGARDGGGHIWLQQSFDQNGIVRQYTKWDHRMEIQDNAGLMISRALAGGAHRAVRAGLSDAAARSVAAQDQGREVSDHGSARRGEARRARRRRHPRDRAAAGQGGESVRAGGALGPQSGDRACAGAVVRTDRAAGRAVGPARLSVLPAQPSALHERREPEGRRRRSSRSTSTFPGSPIPIRRRTAPGSR